MHQTPGIIVPSVTIAPEDTLALARFRDMDYYAVEHYELPIELMMENAGLHLASVVVSAVTNSSQSDKSVANLSVGASEADTDINADDAPCVIVGVGNGNNGGGGLVAARRLAAWGYDVRIHAFTSITKPLPAMQLERAIAFGAKLVDTEDLATLSASIWVDAYLGFSQQLPLPSSLREVIEYANEVTLQRVSLDLPTGFLGDVETPFFQAHTVMTLAAAKTVLTHLPLEVDVLIADLGIPKAVYAEFEHAMLPFHVHRLWRWSRETL